MHPAAAEAAQFQSVSNDAVAGHLGGIWIAPQSLRATNQGYRLQRPAVGSMLAGQSQHMAPRQQPTHIRTTNHCVPTHTMLQPHVVPQANTRGPAVCECLSGACLANCARGAVQRLGQRTVRADLATRDG